MILRRPIVAALLVVLLFALTSGCGADGSIADGAVGVDLGVVDASVASKGDDLAGPHDLAGADDAARAFDAGSAFDLAGSADLVFVQPPIFDLTLIRDQATAKCTFSNHRTGFKDGVLLDIWNVSYLSWESLNGALKPILIRGFASRPAGKVNLPGIVRAHGLGGHSKESHAAGSAALIGTFVIAYTGPGGGDEMTNTSEGLPAGHNNNGRLFDTIPDARGSWFWGHTVAAMRGLTCLESRNDVDDKRLGMLGTSAGGVATLIAAAVDDRIKAAVPLSASGGWNEAVRSPDAWQHELLKLAGLTIKSARWLRLLDKLDSTVLLPKTAVKILMVNGSTDEFFPLTAHVATYKAIPGGDKRTSISANFDHGCYKISGVESAGKIEDRALIRANGGQRMWFRHWFGTDNRYAYLPKEPVVNVQSAGGLSSVTAVVDSGGPSLSVEKVDLWWSNDDSFIYLSSPLDSKGNGVYSKVVPVPVQHNTVYFVDVQYRTKEIVFPDRFSISSMPWIAPGMIPHIRSMQKNCL